MILRSLDFFSEGSGKFSLNFCHITLHREENGLKEVKLSYSHGNGEKYMWF